ncbi:4-coumarate--CoA ligase [Rhodovulum sp. P5]|uniref:4-coumarate--CoA ligase n=1 Tax=Rhodovulum sp. P5 TaxID=1564506 RepID=UPI0009C1CFA0|nr:4-coumarate--CoA ligase [Rhodovulum sp. P5]ARE42195.1 4-coumarate--CoA ligase [Rhodovulum sp. P5]
MTPEKLEKARPPLLGKDEARRLCIALIEAEQDRLLREGRIDRTSMIGARLAGAGTIDPDDLLIDEATLGFDSLSLLDLIMSLNRYFGLASTGVEDYLLVQRRLGDWADLVAHHFELVGRDAEITFTTSGSTGPGKLIRHGRDVLEAEMSGVADLLQPYLRPDTRVLSMVAPLHIYGFLWACLLPRMTGLEVRDIGALSPTRLLREARSGDIVLGTPFTWAQLAKTGGRLPDDVTGVSAGATSTRDTWQAVAEIGLDRLIDIFGSTETGGVGMRAEEGTPFTLLAHLTRCGEDIARKSDPTTPLALQDRLDWTDARAFRVLGRNDTVVQIAGTNVNPDAVREVLRADPAVADAAVRLDGDRLKAFVVPTDGAGDTGPLETALRDRVNRELPAPARPDRFTFGPRIPRNAIGKLADW